MRNILRSAIAVLMIGTAAIVFSTPADAKKSKGTEIAKVRAELWRMKRDLDAVRKQIIDYKPKSMSITVTPTFLSSIAAYPPEGIERLLVAPVREVPAPTETETPKTLTGYRDHVERISGKSMSAAPQPLQMWMRKVASACSGFKVISVCRPGARVRGSGRTSLHASCRAVDFQVASPTCAWGVLNRKGDRFPGGLSRDYKRVNHYHVSWAKSSGEWSARFNHGGGRYYASRKYKKSKYARRGTRRADIGMMEISAAAKEQRGIASHYSSSQRVACGGRLNPGAMTVAHRTLPCGTMVTVTNLRNGRFVVARVVDRGPFIRGRIVDVTPAAARQLRFRGLTSVSVRRAR